MGSPRNRNSVSPARPIVTSPSDRVVRERSRSQTPDQQVAPSWYSPEISQSPQLRDAIEAAAAAERGGADNAPSETMLFFAPPRSPAQKISDSQVDGPSEADCLAIVHEAITLLHDLRNMQLECGNFLKFDVVHDAMNVLFEVATEAKNGVSELTDVVQFPALQQVLEIYTTIAQEPRFAEAIDNDPVQTRAMQKQLKLLAAAIVTTTEKGKRLDRNAKAQARASKAKGQQASRGPSESDGALQRKLLESGSR